MMVMMMMFILTHRSENYAAGYIATATFAIHICSLVATCSSILR